MIDKRLLISLITGIFIYFRTLDYYKVMPRKNILVSLLISLWTYVSIKQPWFIVAGLLVINILNRIM